MTTRAPSLIGPEFAMLLRGEAHWFGLAVDANGEAVTWPLQPIDPPLSPAEDSRVCQRAREELLKRQAWWREQHEARELNRRINVITLRGRL